MAESGKLNQYNDLKKRLDIINRSINNISELNLAELPIITIEKSIKKLREMTNERNEIETEIYDIENRTLTKDEMRIEYEMRNERTKEYVNKVLKPIEKLQNEIEKKIYSYESKDSPIPATDSKELDNAKKLLNDITDQYNEKLKLLDELENLRYEPEGKGVILRDPTINPPQVRNLLNSIGQEKVSSIKLIRTPLSKATQFLLNIASFGQLQEKMKEIGIDKLFHLSMLINGQYELEKNEVIKMRVNPNAVKSDSETLDVPINTDITIQQLMDNTQKQMGQNYGSYDAKTNNCSIFLSNVLSANGLSNSNSETFINQKTEELFNSFPALSKKIVDLGTTAGAVVERQISGEGEGEYIYNFGLPRCKLLF